MCNMSCATWYEGTSQLLRLTKFRSHLVQLYFIGWNYELVKGGRKREYPEKSPNNELQNRHTNTHTHTQAQTHTPIHTHAHVHTHTHTYTDSFPCTQTHTSTRTHTHTRACGRLENENGSPFLFVWVFPHGASFLILVMFVIGWLWCRQAWDMALDLCLQQLPLDENGENFQHCPFFAEQLTAFQVWLMYGFESRPPPEQLPIVLQVSVCMCLLWESVALIVTVCYLEECWSPGECC